MTPEERIAALEAEVAHLKRLLDVIALYLPQPKGATQVEPEPDYMPYN